jgi:hypothetical protein
MLNLCSRQGLSIHELILANEDAQRPIAGSMGKAFSPGRSA